VTPKGQGRDPIIFEAPYLHKGAIQVYGHNGPFIEKCWWWIKWSCDWECLLFRYNNREGWQ